MSKFKPNQAGPAKRRSIRPARTVFGRQASGDPSEQSAQAPQVQSIEESLDDSVSSIQIIGFYAVLFFIFFRFSFLHEFVGAKLGANLHVIIILGGLSYLGCLLSGRISRAFRDRSTIIWVGFAACMALATLTSFWKGGSFPIFNNYIQTAFPMVLVLPALVVTKPQILKLINTIGLACILTVLLGTFNDDFTSGRMGVDVASSEIQNPNDYAAHMILMLPALAFWAFQRRRTIAHKLIGGLSMALCLRQILSSGSRGALVSLGVMTLIVLLISPKRIKAVILIGVPTLALIAIPFVPKESMERLATLFSAAAAAKDSSAQESSEARIALLQESWKLTLSHPFLGVGPGEFVDYQAKVAGENGQRGMWHVTHNAYTQVSSECGIPAFLLFVGALGATLVNLVKAYRARDPELSPAAGTLIVMLVSYGVCIFFLSLAYTVHLLIISAVAVSMRLRLPKQPATLDSRSIDAPEAVPA